MRTEKNKKLCLKVFKPKKVKKATFEEIKALGKLEEFNSYPEGMLKEFKNCKKLFCQSKKAGKKVYEIFVKRGSLWHQRHPGDMIYGMAWYEIMYLGKFKKTQVHIDRYLKLGPDKYPKKYPYWFRENDIAAIHSLIKMNKGRIKMREALGFSAEDDLATVLHQYFLLGDFIANDKVKVKKVKMSPELKKRKELLSQYRSALNRYKSKLEEEEG